MRGEVCYHPDKRAVESDVDIQQPGCYWVRYTRGTDLAILTVVVE